VYRNLRPNSSELQHLFAEADVFALPTLADCLALVLMEATAAALPVIATDVGGVGEAMRANESGLLIRAGDNHQLRAALSALVDDSHRRRSMGKAGYNLARARFDADQNNVALFELLTDLARARQDPGRRVA
jgi:glycosyltransferase involved in cell wall biosynthesis